MVDASWDQVGWWHMDAYGILARKVKWLGQANGHQEKWAQIPDLFSPVENDLDQLNQFHYICFETSQVVSTSEQKICKCKCHKRRLRAYPWAIMAPCPSLPWNAPGWLRNCAELWPSFSILFPAIIHCGPMWTICFLALTFCFQPNCYVCRAALACVLCQFQILLAGNWDELSWVNFVSGLPWVAQSGSREAFSAFAPRLAEPKSIKLCPAWASLPNGKGCFFEGKPMISRLVAPRL